MELGVTAFLTDHGMQPAELALEVEARGYSSLWLPQHTHMPVRADTPPGLVAGVSLDDYKRGLDPIVSLAAAAVATKRIRLGTGVLLVAQQDPINLAKQIATLDLVSGGRVVLGVGAGWNRAEAEDHGIDFLHRRAILREHVLCMQALWRDDPAEFHGQHVDLQPCWSWPKPARRSLPILIGGGATESVWRAVCDYGDGWLPIGGSGLAAGMARLRALAEAAGRDPAAIQVIPFGTVPEAGKLDHYRDLGVSEVVLRIRNGPRDDLLRQLDAYAGFQSLSG